MSHNLEIGQRIRALLPEWLIKAESLPTGRRTVQGVIQNITASSIVLLIEGTALPKNEIIPLPGNRKVNLSFKLIEKREIRVAVVESTGSVTEVFGLKPPANPYPYGRIYVAGTDIMVAGTPFDYLDRCKSVLGGRWDKYEKGDKAWFYPATPSAALNLFLAFNGSKTVLNDEAFLALVEQGKKLDDALELKLASEDELKQPAGLKTRMWLHQLRASYFASAMPGCGLFMDMGTGKSLVVLSYILQNDIRYTLVIAPKSVVDVWPLEWEEHVEDATREQFILCALPRGSVAKKTQLAQAAYDEARHAGKKLIVVINYDSARMPPFGLEQSKGSKKRGFSFQVPWDLLVVDESQEIKNHKAVTSKYCHKLAGVIPHRLVLTGTPMPHDPSDIFSQYLVIDRGETFGTSFSRFMRRYAIMGGYKGKEIVDWVNKDEIEDLMYRRAFRVTEDVSDLPPRIFTVRYGELDEEEWRVYSEMEEEYEAEVGGTFERLDDPRVLAALAPLTDAASEGKPLDMDDPKVITAANVLSRMMKLSQMTSGFMNDENKQEVEIGQSKLKLLLEVLDEIKRDEPLVIFARFKRDIAKIKAALGERGYKVAELSGSRNEWREWRQGKFQVIVVQLQAGGVGINFTKCGERQCKYCLYYGKDFNWGNYKQSIKRIHRPGQKETTIFITLVMRGTIDEKIEEVLETRGNLVEAIVNARSFKHVERGIEKTQTKADDEDRESAKEFDTWDLHDEVAADLGALLVAGGYVNREEME